MIILVIVKIYLINASSRLCFLHKVSMTFIRSSVGMLVYMFEISSEVSFNSGTIGISDKSFMRCTEFWTLYKLEVGYTTLNCL